MADIYEVVVVFKIEAPTKEKAAEAVRQWAQEQHPEEFPEGTKDYYIRDEELDLEAVINRHTV